MSFITQKIYLLFIFPFIFFGILIDISSFVLNGDDYHQKRTEYARKSAGGL